MTGQKDRASAIIAGYLQRRDAGEDVAPEELLRSHPDLADELRRYFENEAVIGQLAPSPPAPAHPGYRETTRSAAAGDSVPTSRQPLSDLPAEFGRYRVLKRLGQGAMGAVYLARDTALDRDVALKTPKLDASEDAELIERFEREAKAAATLHHRNICPVFDVGVLDGVRYLTMAYIDGKSLSAFVSSHKQLSERQATIAVRKLALALQAAHSAGVVHRDLKPANVMVDKSGEPVIMDFGLARKLESRESTRLTQVGTIMGSPAYMSPEQVSGDPDAVGPQSDIYSLGVILYELLTGQLPFEGSIAAVIGQIMTADPPDVASLRTGLDPRLQAICQKMMARSTEDRYQSMQEVADALSDVLRNRKPSTSGTRQPADSAARSVTSTSEELAVFQQIVVSDERTSVKLPPRSRTLGAKRTQKSRKAGGWWNGLPPWQKWTAGGFGAMALLAGVVILFKGGRVEVDDGSTVKISQDGDQTTVQITPGASDSGAVTASGAKGPGRSEFGVVPVAMLGTPCLDTMCRPWHFVGRVTCSPWASRTRSSCGTCRKRRLNLRSLSRGWRRPCNSAPTERRSSSVPRRRTGGQGGFCCSTWTAGVNSRSCPRGGRPSVHSQSVPTAERSPADIGIPPSACGICRPASVARCWRRRWPVRRSRRFTLSSSVAMAVCSCPGGRC